MNERTTEVLEQYELEVQSKRRGRGAWICETSQGLKLLREYKGTVKRLEFEEQIMNVLQIRKHAGPISICGTGRASFCRWRRMERGVL